jgi:hypothetical protein
MPREGISIGLLPIALLAFVVFLRQALNPTQDHNPDHSLRSGSPDSTTESDPSAGAEFGASFAILPDHDGDGWKNILVGSPADRGGVVHEYSGDPPCEISRWGAPAGATQFGQTLARVDGGDASAFLVGAPDWFDQASGEIACYSAREGKLLSRWSKDPGEAFFGEFVALGDVDGDGDPEILLVVRNGWAPSHVERDTLLMVAGRSGKRLRSHAFERSLSYAERGIASLPDIDGDSVPDYAACMRRNERGALVVFSGRDGSELEVVTTSDPIADVTGPIVVGGDQDGDGVYDLTYGCTERVEKGYGRCWLSTYSTAKHAFVREVLVPAETLVEAVAFPDRNGDAIDELLVGIPEAFPESGALLLDGATGECVARFAGPVEELQRGYQIAVADPNGDGTLEVIMTCYSPYSGGDGVIVMNAADGSTRQRITARSGL